MISRGGPKGSTGCPVLLLAPLRGVKSERRGIRGCHKDAHPFFFLLWHPLSDVWWLPNPEVPQLVVVVHLNPKSHGFISQHVHCFWLCFFLVFFMSACYPQRLPPTAIGYPPTAIGYPPTALGYPPTAIVGRIGHSEFFFSFITAPLRGIVWERNAFIIWICGVYRLLMTMCHCRILLYSNVWL